MYKLIFPRGEEKYLHVKTLSTCIMVKNYIEQNYGRQNLTAISFCGDEAKRWKFTSINSILTFYAYLLNNEGIGNLKIRVKAH